jgi:hypothetical protein
MRYQTVKLLSYGRSTHLQLLLSEGPLKLQQKPPALTDFQKQIFTLAYV